MEPSIESALQGIFQAIERVSPDHLEISLSGGLSGLALLHAYQCLAAGEKGAGTHSGKALSLMEKAVERLPEMIETPGLFMGYAGVAWTVEHLMRLGIIPTDEDLNEDIDTALLTFLAPDGWRGLPELVGGLSGLGLYALDREGRGRSGELLERVLDLLDRKRRVMPEGIAWFDDPEDLHPITRSANPKGVFNLGLSHGNPGVIGFLAQAAGKGHARALALLEPAMSWLLAQQSPHLDGSAYGAGYFPGEPKNPRGGRLSWCYGDLGIALVFVLAGQRTGRLDWQELGLGLARDCARRPDPMEGIADAGLCHGAIGNSHLFNRLHQATGQERFRELAIQCLHVGMGWRRNSEEAGGFFAHIPAQPGECPREPWVPSLGLLGGATGIGLVLLASTTSIEPQWDRHLLIDVAPKEVR